MAQGFYGGYMGNAGALNDLVYRGEPTQNDANALLRRWYGYSTACRRTQL